MFQIQTKNVAGAVDLDLVVLNFRNVSLIKINHEAQISISGGFLNEASSPPCSQTFWCQVAVCSLLPPEDGENNLCDIFVFSLP